MVKKNISNKKLNVFLVIVPILFIMIIGFIFLGKGFDTNKGSSEGVEEKNLSNTVINDNGELVISIKDISETASFYQVNVDGTDVEVLAVKAPDGTIRTAFNTCQVCYDSGKGYYKQSGDALICQNCGNQFKMNEVERIKGGCNPVPISSDNKTVNEETIVISKDFLEESKNIFTNWK